MKNNRGRFHLIDIVRLKDKEINECRTLKIIRSTTVRLLKQ